MISLPKPTVADNLTPTAISAIEDLGTIHVRWLLEVWPLRPAHQAILYGRQYDTVTVDNYEALQQYVAAYGSGSLYSLCSEVDARSRRAGGVAIHLLVLLAAVLVVGATLVASLQ